MNEATAHRKQHDVCLCLETEFAKDMCAVRFHCAGAYRQPSSDSAVRHPLRHEMENLSLAVSQGSIDVAGVA